MSTPLVTGAALLLLSGCGPNKSYNPIDWWHDLQGGPIADTRPPPPNADAPYPNLGSVPDKPAAPDAATRGKIASGLVADRANAQYTASLSPLQAPPAAGAPPPPPPPRPAARPVTDDMASATLQGASGPPKLASSGEPARAAQGPPQQPLPNVPVTPPRRAPTTEVQAAPLEAPPASTEAAPSPPPVADATPPSNPSPPAPRVRAATRPAPVAATAPPGVSSGGLPPLPDRAPPPPRLAGVPAVTAPTPPPPTPPPPPPPAAPVVAGAPVAIGFPPGSAVLPTSSFASLKLLAQKRGDTPIAVTGFGEAKSSDAAAQSAALPLALARARAIAANLLAAGVPANAIRINAESAGSGGAAQLSN